MSASENTLTVRARIALKADEKGVLRGEGTFYEWPILVKMVEGADGTPVVYIADRQPWDPMFLVDGFGPPSGYMDALGKPTVKPRR